ALANLDPAAHNLEVSALFVKGRTLINGQPRYFHLQITASGLGPVGTKSEANLFQKVPDVDHVDAMHAATDTHVVITIRGVGEMTPGNPDSSVVLSTTQQDFGQPKAKVALADAADPPPAGAPQQTRDDHLLWNAMD